MKCAPQNKKKERKQKGRHYVVRAPPHRMYPNKPPNNLGYYVYAPAFIQRTRSLPISYDIFVLSSPSLSGMIRLLGSFLQQECDTVADSEHTHFNAVIFAQLLIKFYHGGGGREILEALRVDRSIPEDLHDKTECKDFSPTLRPFKGGLASPRNFVP